MNRALTFLILALVSWVRAAPPPQAEQQARLLNFRPVVSKDLDESLPDRELLLQIARDTWGYFRDIVDKENWLPLDNVVVTSSYNKVGSFTSTTNMGMYLMCLVAATDFGYMLPVDAQRRAERLLDTLDKMERWGGHPFNYYETMTLEPSGRFVSSVDNGWLAAGLIVARQAFPALAPRADAVLEAMEFGPLYDPEIGQLYGGFNALTEQSTEHHYGLFCTEPRLASLVAIARGDVPREHWYRIFRTLPGEWDWQRQKPRGRWRVMGGRRVFYGYYERKGARYVPSWGGSMFEFLMPTLVLDEQGLSPRGLGANNRAAVREQIRYALDEKGYPVWGMSPCSVPDEAEGYREYGVPHLGSKGYPDQAVVTPHASFLALTVDGPAAVANIRRLAQFEGIYGEYGFRDSINVQTGAVSPRFLLLDQAMTFLSLDNYLNGGAIQKRFESYPPVQAQLDLLRNEVFFR